MHEFIKHLPKAELHVHIEGTMEPQQLALFAQRNGIEVPPGILSDDKTKYLFNDYPSFINTYIQATKVLYTEQDFYDLTWAYLQKALEQGVLHTEIFFDLQTYMPRGMAPETIINGLHRALAEGKKQFGISGQLIMCFIRHLDEDDALKALELLKPFKDKVVAVGLASLELNNPPEKFQRVFVKAKEYGFRRVAHAAECNPARGGGPNLVRRTINLLDVERIDHGIAVIDDPALTRELADKKIPLTVCPISNVWLKCFNSLADHPLKRMLGAGLMVTINSDDPAFFRAYIADTYEAVAKVLGLTREDLVICARNSFEAAFMDEQRRVECLSALNNFCNKYVL